MERGAEAENAYWILDTVEMKQPGIQLVFESELATGRVRPIGGPDWPFRGARGLLSFLP